MTSLLENLDTTDPLTEIAKRFKEKRTITQNVFVAPRKIYSQTAREKSFLSRVGT